MEILHVITGMQKAAGTSVFAGEVCNTLAEVGHEVKALTKACGHAGRVTLPEMGRRGRKLVEEKYAWQAVAKTLLEAYASV